MAAAAAPAVAVPRLLVALILAAAALAGARGGAIDSSRWYGRTIYFVVTDRFARDTDTADDAPACAGKGWCGGTLRGVQRKLDYIQGMGFDAIWITPVVKQVEWLDDYNGTGYHGYWAADFYRIDPHLGSEADLAALSRACHERGMLLMLDVVANHVGPIHSLEQVKRLGGPLGRWHGEQFHQLGRSPGESFVSYIHHPVSSFAPGCWPQYGDGCNETVIKEGWFGDLADLRQEHPETRSYLLGWIRHMVKQYDLDGIRLDTALYMPKWFLEQFQQAAGVYMIGEVVTYNFSFHRSFTPALQGLLNFPVAAHANSVFSREGSLVHLRHLLKEQRMTNYSDVHLLGNFVDNHDNMRFLFNHSGEVSLLENGLAWALLYHGIPIVYYGTEQEAVSNQEDERTSMWPHFHATSLYRYIGELHRLRRHYGLAAGGLDVTEPAAVVAASPRALAFVRGDLLVVVTNAGAGGDPESLCAARSSLPPRWASLACRSRDVHEVLGLATAGAGARCWRDQLCVKTGPGRPAIYALSRRWVSIAV